MITWPDLEAALQGRPGWRRIGRTWRGAPCPSCGGGTRDTAWVGPGKTAEFVAGCNAGCNGLVIARALVPDTGQRPVACGVARAPHTGRTRAYAHVTGQTLTRTAGGRLAGVCGSTGATRRNLPHGAGPAGTVAGVCALAVY